MSFERKGEEWPLSKHRSHIFGGKSKQASAIWERLGPNVRTYIEPCFGSGAVFLARPDWMPDHGFSEIINDADGMVCNFWRAVQAAPDKVAKYADWPVIENDLHARHAWMTERQESLQSKLEGDPSWFNAKIAGWWAWGMSCKLGGNFCAGDGPWVRKEIDGQMHLVKTNRKKTKGKGVSRSIPLGERGLHKKTARGISRSIPKMGPQGVNRSEVYKNDFLLEWMRRLCWRLRQVRICCGDWSRVCEDVFTKTNQGITAIFFDPPYGGNPDDLCHDIYRKDSITVSADICKWALAHGNNPRFRIALCGYEGEHDIPDSWECLNWRAQGGYGNHSKEKIDIPTNAAGKKLKKKNANRHRERIWFSPHCVQVASVTDPLSLP